MNTQQIKKSIVKPASLFSVLAVISMLLAACAPSAQAVEGESTSTPVVSQPTTATNPAPATPAAETEIRVATDPTLGQILVDGKGMTLYIFTVDEADKSNCDAACLQAWPPLLTQGNPALGEGVDSSLISSTSLADGTKIVTYNHMPLYYYIQDKSAGATAGQGVGSVWYVVSPEGKSSAWKEHQARKVHQRPRFTGLNVGTDPALGTVPGGWQGHDPLHIHQ
jgi:predicted lipoprotein with Yx(FWY)xxD motif